MYSTLDADEESHQLQRRAKLMASALGSRIDRPRAEISDLLRFEEEARTMPVDADYDGPTLSFPITYDQIISLIEAFKQSKILHYKYASQLVMLFRQQFSALPTLVETKIAAGTKLTVVGDTHGQLQDLFSIFTINGLPSPTNRYLFNGDFVDRGDYGCEILFVLMSFVLFYGSNDVVLINRGNHESSNQNITGGFLSEVL